MIKSYKKLLSLLCIKNTQMTRLEKAINHPLYKSHKRNKSKYTMDGGLDKWILVYYPLFENGKTGEAYKEPRALMQNTDKPGFWSKEVPLRYLCKC